jgi:hypothetical protein
MIREGRVPEQGYRKILEVEIEKIRVEEEAAEPEVEQVAELLGGQKVLRRQLKTPLEAHEMIREGLSIKTLRRRWGSACGRFSAAC